jgi:hypothetical protein
MSSKSREMTQKPPEAILQQEGGPLDRKQKEQQVPSGFSEANGGTTSPAIQLADVSSQA